MNNAMLYITIGPEVVILFSHSCVFFFSCHDSVRLMKV